MAAGTGRAAGFATLPMAARLEAEKATIERVRRLREEFERIRREIEEAEQRYDLDRA